MLNVLVLLETNFILPLNILVFFLSLNNLLLLLRQLFANLVVFDLPFEKTSNLFFDMLKGLDNHIIVSMLDILLTVGRGFTNLFVFEVTTKRGDHVHVESGNVVVVVMDVLILCVVLCLQLFNCLVLFRFDFGNFSLALRLHVLSQSSHLGLILFLDLVGDALILLALGSGQSIEVLVKGVLVLSLANVLLLSLNLKGAQVLLEFTLINAVLIL